MQVCRLNNNPLREKILTLGQARNPAHNILTIINKITLKSRSNATHSSTCFNCCCNKQTFRMRMCADVEEILREHSHRRAIRAPFVGCVWNVNCGAAF